MLKIITGTAKGRNIKTLEGEATRPTSERIKEAMFSSIQFDIENRRIHSRRFTKVKLLHNSKERLKFNKKTINSLLNSACNTLNQAKKVHDQLESHYINAMNFSKLNQFADKFCKKLF